MKADFHLPQLQLFSRDEIKKEVWRALPIWFFFIEAIGVLHFEVANVSPEQYSAVGHTVFGFALTAIFPLFWVLAYYYVRISESKRVENKSMLYLVIPAGFIALPVLIYLFYKAVPAFQLTLSESTMRFMFEYMQLFWIILFVVHGFKSRGIHRFITFYCVALVYGLILENSGIAFEYFYEKDYQFYLWRLPAPFATMMGWCLVFYCCTWVTEFFRERWAWLRQTPLRSALFATAIALSLDAQLDPLASLSGVFWKWNELLPPWFLGVPFCNYAAWFGAFMPFSWAYFYIIERGDLNEWQKNWKLFVHIPLIALAAGVIWLVLMTLYEGGFDGPTYQILSAFLDRLFPYAV